MLWWREKVVSDMRGILKVYPIEFPDRLDTDFEINIIKSRITSKFWPKH